MYPDGAVYPHRSMFVRFGGFCAGWASGIDMSRWLARCMACLKIIHEACCACVAEPLFMLAKSLLPGVFVPSGVAGSIFLGFFCIYQLAKAQISPTFRSPKGTFQQSI